MKLGLQTRAGISGGPRAELYFDTVCIECDAPVRYGSRRCPKHLERKSAHRRGYWAGHEAKLVESSGPLPPWMSDPSLLPKRPPAASVPS